MSPTQRDPWHDLGETLAGRFTARARGLFASDFVLLDTEGKEIGRLEINGTRSAKLSAGDIEARIERSGRSGYKMLSQNAEVLTVILTSTGDATSPRITYQNHPYETTLSLLRNKAEAGPPGHTTIRIDGGLTNRSYTAIFDPHDRGSPPVALFLLYHLVSLRREAYRTG
jgi:hypothetical protein